MSWTTTEIRFTYHAGQSHELLSSHGISNWLEKLDWSVERELECADHELHPRLPVLLVNRQIRDEVKYIIHSLECKTCLNLKVARQIMQSTVPSMVSFRALTKITFQLSNKALFDLLGVEVYPVFRLDPSKASASASQFLSIRTLQDVHVDFESPHRGACTSPWGHLERRIGLDRHDGAYYVCCQRVVADWISTFAYPIFFQMSGVVVHLKGEIKSDTKNEWLDESNSRRQHDQDAALRKILGTEDCKL